ncbi:hypothetical protein CRUP_031106, partial [Coryphaenoides rupestris]
MCDKRQRARVQGSWAKQLPRAPRGTAGTAPNTPQPTRTNPPAWGIGSDQKTFDFQQPTKTVREAPAEKLIELRLVPGFLAAQEADWLFSKLLAELPWSQKTNYRQVEPAAAESAREGAGGVQRGLQLPAVQPVPRRQG